MRLKAFPKISLSLVERAFKSISPSICKYFSIYWKRFQTVAFATSDYYSCSNYNNQ